MDENTTLTDQQRAMLEALQYMRENPQEIVKAAARKDLLAFARYMQPSLDIQPCHAVYYRILNEFAYGRVKKLIVTFQPQVGKARGQAGSCQHFCSDLTPIRK